MLGFRKGDRMGTRTVSFALAELIVLGALGAPRCNRRRSSRRWAPSVHGKFGAEEIRTMGFHGGTERIASWLHLAFASLVLIAVLVRSASALTVEYNLNAYAAYSGTGTGFCASGISLSSCGFFGYSNSSDLTPAVGFPPLPSFINGFGQAEQTAVAQQFPASISSSAFADFQILPARALLSAFASSDGGNTVRFEQPTGDGGTSIVQLSTDSYASIALRLQETLKFSIPAVFDGQELFATVSIPVHAFGSGASSAFLSASVTGLGGFEQGQLVVGHRGFFSDIGYDVSSSIDLRVLIRPEGSTERTVYAPFSL